MRLRKIKNAGNILSESKYVVNDKDLSDYLKKINIKGKVQLEIGSGKGQFIVNKAINNKDNFYIAIEKYDSVLIRALELLEDKELDNLILVCTDASKLSNYLSKQVDTIFLNFSDPWPKSKHEKRRLTSNNFLEVYDSLFKDEKHIIFKTDNKALFAYSVKNITNYGYKIVDISLDLHKENIENIKTEYEEKFNSLGFTINYLEVKK